MTRQEPVRDIVTILYAEESVASCDAFKNFIENTEAARKELGPCNVITISSEQDILNAVDQNEFDIVLIDCHRTDVSSLEIAQKLLSKRPECPLLFMAQKGSEHRALEAISLEVTDYLIRDKDQTYLKFAPILIKKLLPGQRQSRTKSKPNNK